MNHFHLAIASHDLAQAKAFYIDALNGQLGRHTAHAMIVNFFQTQLVLQKVDQALIKPKHIYPNHFGICFDSLGQYQSFLGRAKTHKLSFFIEPKCRFEGMAIEHHTFFLLDPSNNLIEAKYYAHKEAIFGCGHIDRLGDHN